MDPTDIWKLADCPALMVAEPRLEGIEKSGGGGMFTFTVTTAERFPLVAVMVDDPLATADTSPVLLTVATAGVLEL